MYGTIAVFNLYSHKVHTAKLVCDLRTFQVLLKDFPIVSRVENL